MSYITQLENFFQQYKPFTYKKGEIIERPGNFLQFVYYVKDGYVKQYALSWGGEELILNMYNEHAYFYVIFPFSLTNHSYYFSAMTEVTCYRAPRTELVEFMQQNPDILFKILERIHQYGVISLCARMESLVFGNTRSKIAAAVYLTAERFGIPVPNTADSRKIPIPLTHKDIASLSGVTRETASVEIARLKRGQIISANGEKLITVHSMEQIKKVSLIT